MRIAACDSVIRVTNAGEKDYGFETGAFVVVVVVDVAVVVGAAVVASVPAAGEVGTVDVGVTAAEPVGVAAAPEVADADPAAGTCDVGAGAPADPVEPVVPAGA